MAGTLFGVAACFLGLCLVVSASGIHHLERRTFGTCYHSGQYRELPGTSGCVVFQRCDYGHWSHEQYACHHGLLDVRTHKCTTEGIYDIHACTVYPVNGHLSATSITRPVTTSHPTTPGSISIDLGASLLCGDKRCYHGYCHFRTPHYFKCICYTGYTGDSCKMKLAPSTNRPVTTTHPTTSITTSPDQGTSHLCGDTICFYGHCHIKRNHSKCTCWTGYTGESCTMKSATSSPRPVTTSHPTTSLTTSPDLVNVLLTVCGDTRCYNGYCSAMAPGDSKCTCWTGYAGDSCNITLGTTSHPTTAGTTNPDLGNAIVCGATRCYNGYCHYTTPVDSKCKCWTGYTGETCSQILVQPTTKSTTTSPTTITTTIPTTITTPITTTTAPSTTTIPTTTPTTTTPITTTTTIPTTTTTPMTTTTTIPTTTTTIPTTTTTTPTTTTITPITATTIPTTTKTPTTTTTPTTPTTVPIRLRHCNPTGTVMSIINGALSKNNDLLNCPSGSFASPEAFVLEHCQLPTPFKWTPGLNVDDHCSTIPLYTPIATFNHDMYPSSGGISGIFLGCLPAGFKIGVQKCDHLPTIMHVLNGGSFTMDPSVYYTVQ